MVKGQNSIEKTMNTVLSTAQQKRALENLLKSEGWQILAQHIDIEEQSVTQQLLYGTSHAEETTYDSLENRSLVLIGELRNITKFKQLPQSILTGLQDSYGGKT